ncbi:hypothetical protein LHK99_28755 [Klebsiella quasipneumoniae]|uniref:hypothetical protein n=1 Tax=Klebsiella quasipneumoniae TaxID=1463165 RepID=UPI001CFB1676|nr:hypothetical protein [Klebsiella quasipneumoniae]MCB4714643.1 hypothetical protein [Klebsiella quasipneumoniae]
MGSCAAPSAKGDDKFITTDYLQQCPQEQGLQVLYAPGKRLAFRVRWYLILLAVLSPLLWLIGRWVLTLWLGSIQKTEFKAR